jgi:DNA-binding transcriptional MerR regulator
MSGMTVKRAKSTRRSRLAPKSAARSKAAHKNEYSIDELARAASSTVRNVRAYQDRGLVPPPERRGRNGIYTESHLARIRLISQLLDRGYSLSNIGELLDAWQQGQDLTQLLGLENALTSPWSDEVPSHITLPELMKTFGGVSPDTLRKVIELGVLQPDGLRFLMPSPRMIQAAGELAKLGIPLSEMLDIVRMLRGNVERVAKELIQLIEKYMFKDFVSGHLPPPEEVPHLSDAIWRLRPLVNMAVTAEVARAMEKTAKQVLGDRLSYILEHLHDGKYAGR